MFSWYEFCHLWRSTFPTSGQCTDSGVSSPCKSNEWWQGPGVATPSSTWHLNSPMLHKKVQYLRLFLSRGRRCLVSAMRTTRKLQKTKNMFSSMKRLRNPRFWKRRSQLLCHTITTRLILPSWNHEARQTWRVSKIFCFCRFGLLFVFYLSSLVRNALGKSRVCKSTEMLLFKKTSQHFPNNLLL